MYVRICFELLCVTCIVVYVVYVVVLLCMLYCVLVSFKQNMLLRLLYFCVFVHFRCYCYVRVVSVVFDYCVLFGEGEGRENKDVIEERRECDVREGREQRR